jgi:hypothetical protein
MCDPVAAITLVGAVASAGFAAQQGMAASQGLQETNDANNNANNQWLAFQQRARQTQQAADEAARQKEDAARVATLAKVSPEAQAATQSAEQARLTSLYGASPGGAGMPAPGASALLSGQSGSKDVGSLTEKINQATAQASARIKALAAANSYGGSFGGLATTTPIAFAQGGNDINLMNNIRQGNLKTFGVQQAVQPVHYTVGPGTEAAATLGKAAGSLAGSLAAIGGPRAITDLQGASTGVVDASGNLTPGFVNNALTSFNDPSANWSQWG